MKRTVVYFIAINIALTLLSVSISSCRGFSSNRVPRHQLIEPPTSKQYISLIINNDSLAIFVNEAYDRTLFGPRNFSDCHINTAWHKHDNQMWFCTRANQLGLDENPGSCSGIHIRFEERSWKVLETVVTFYDAYRYNNPEEAWLTGQLLARSENITKIELLPVRPDDQRLRGYITGQFNERWTMIKEDSDEGNTTHREKWDYRTMEQPIPFKINFSINRRIYTPKYESKNKTLIYSNDVERGAKVDCF